MKIKLTIDNQPLVLGLDAVVALFGKTRTLEFADGKWTPFVFFETAEPIESTVVPMPMINVTDLSASQFDDLLNAIPKHIVDFGGFIRDKIDELEKAQSKTP